MSHTRIVLLVEGDAYLFLSGAKYATDGSLRRGYVENGAWDWVKDGDIEYDYNRSHCKHKWPAEQYEIVDVKGVKGDYSEVMLWAEQQSKFNKE
jgi:hypothetical protein